MVMFSSPSLLSKRQQQCVMCASSHKRTYNSAMTSVLCATPELTLTVAWRFASWPGAIYKAFSCCTFFPYLYTSSFQNQNIGEHVHVLLFFVTPNKDEDGPCVRLLKKGHTPPP